MKKVKLIGLTIFLFIWLIPELLIMFVTREPSALGKFIYNTYCDLLYPKDKLKVKLLKKIRQRYVITHYPNGYFSGNNFVKGPITILKDNDDSFRFRASDLNKTFAYENLREHMMHWIEKDYGPFNSKTRKITSEKLWYKDK